MRYRDKHGAAQTPKKHVLGGLTEAAQNGPKGVIFFKTSIFYRIAKRISLDTSEFTSRFGIKILKNSRTSPSPFSSLTLN